MAEGGVYIVSIQRPSSPSSDRQVPYCQTWLSGDAIAMLVLEPVFME